MIGATCQASPTGFVSGLIDYIDCQTQAIGMGGYQALAAPGSILSVLFTGLLTTFIALFGYRMLLGQTPGVRDGILAAAKVGIVLTLAFSWPVYRTLIYDVTLRAPAEFAAAIGRPAGLPGADGGLVARLDYADRAFVTLGEFGTGVGLVAPIGAINPGATTRQSVSPFDPFALGAARLSYLAGALGMLAAMRLIAGLLLALGPLFVAFLLFEGTRGLFEGWLRALLGSALGALATAVVLGVELALLEPRLAELVAWRAAGYAIPGAPVELFATTLIFSIANLVIVVAIWRVTVGLGLPASWRAAPGQLVEAMRGREANLPIMAHDAPTVSVERSRAVRVAEAVAVAQRRETLRGGTGYEAQPRSAQPHAKTSDEAARTGRLPLAQEHRRRTRSRVSASARRRDTSS